MVVKHDPYEFRKSVIWPYLALAAYVVLLVFGRSSVSAMLKRASKCLEPPAFHCKEPCFTTVSDGLVMFCECLPGICGLVDCAFPGPDSKKGHGGQVVDRPTEMKKLAECLPYVGPPWLLKWDNEEQEDRFLVSLLNLVRN